jgi:AcrR family transcriptional regulator
MRAATRPIPALPRRRTQAERRAATRRRILEAVVACIAELGFQRTTATQIAERAGVTWGAVQHHYGGKDGILAAVLDDTFARFASHFDDMPDPAATPLATRARQFVERAWRHFGSAYFRSMFEILLQTFGAPGPKRDAPGEQQLRMLDGLDRLWRRVFPDAPLPRPRRVALESYTLATLMGLALQRALAGGTARRPDAEIALLARTLAGELEAAARARAARAAVRPRAQAQAAPGNGAARPGRTRRKVAAG